MCISVINEIFTCYIECRQTVGDYLLFLIVSSKYDLRIDGREF